MTLSIDAAWCRSPGDEVAASSGLMETEDEATLGRVAVNADRVRLTQALDARTMRAHDGANLSACRLAEWLTWNWWRLRWEPTHQNARRDRGLGWRQAHEMASIGGGWLWPNVTIRSDGLRVVLDAVPSADMDAEPVRYVANESAVVSTEAFETGVDDFVNRVLVRLREWSLADTELFTAWRELSAERADPECATYRKVEAFLGFDVDEADPRRVERIILDGEVLGGSAMSEVAADRFLTAGEFRDAARDLGFDSSAADRAPALADAWAGDGRRAPWEVGVAAADALRRREGLGGGPVSDRRLADLCAVGESALSAAAAGTMAFALHEPRAEGRIVLRSKWRTGRRFEIARLLGDSVLVDTRDSLRPATGASTYRQKMQRAFAAGFLCPVESLIDALNDDFSDDARDAAAERFGVSPLTVTAVLANHGFVDQPGARPREA